MALTKMEKSSESDTLSDGNQHVLALADGMAVSTVSATGRYYHASGAQPVVRTGFIGGSGWARTAIICRKRCKSSFVTKPYCRDNATWNFSERRVVSSSLRIVNISLIFLPANPITCGKVRAYRS